MHHECCGVTHSWSPQRPPIHGLFARGATLSLRAISLVNDIYNEILAGCIDINREQRRDASVDHMPEGVR